jgi:hypothetical protein
MKRIYVSLSRISKNHEMFFSLHDNLKLLEVQNLAKACKILNHETHKLKGLETYFIIIGVFNLHGFKLESTHAFSHNYLP